MQKKRDTHAAVITIDIGIKKRLFTNTPLPSCHMDRMDIPSAATHRRPMLQGLGSEAVEVPCKVFQQAFTLMVELGEKLHIVFSNRLEEKLKWGQVASCADASDQLHIAALNGLT